jgi:hypothetical protein
VKIHVVVFGIMGRGSMFLRNFVNHLPDYMVSQLRRPLYETHDHVRNQTKKKLLHATEIVSNVFSDTCNGCSFMSRRDYVYNYRDYYFKQENRLNIFVTVYIT